MNGDPATEGRRPANDPRRWLAGLLGGLGVYVLILVPIYAAAAISRGMGFGPGNALGLGIDLVAAGGPGRIADPRWQQQLSAPLFAAVIAFLLAVISGLAVARMAVRAETPDRRRQFLAWGAVGAVVAVWLQLPALRVLADLAGALLASG